MPQQVIAFGFVSVLLAIGGLAFPMSTSAHEQEPRQHQPGWPDVFISLGGGYLVTFERPVVGKGEKPETYQQKATYMWSGGRHDILHITLARDPAFKDQYSAEALQKEKHPPKELEVNKKKAWQWEFPREGGKPDQIARRLVVLLDADKAIILEHKGAGVNLEAVAKMFDFAKVEKALASPPK